MENCSIVFLHKYSSKKLQNKLAFLNDKFFDVIRRIRKYTMIKKKRLFVKNNYLEYFTTIRYNPYTTVLDLKHKFIKEHIIKNLKNKLKLNGKILKNNQYLSTIKLNDIIYIL